LVKDAAMQDSPSHSNLMTTAAFEQALLGQMQGNPLANSTASTLNGSCDETIEFEEDPSLCIPPSFNCMLHEERLQEEDWPYIV